MTGNNMMGIIFANSHDEMMADMTERRAMGSLPFGGRYRLIDFSLSNMVNADVSKVGVITKSNYQSLMDHLGSGKAWDLARKNGGLFILPPFAHASSGVYNGHIEALSGINGFLEFADEDYVVMCDADVVSNFDLKKMLRFHIDNGADITIGYKNGLPPKGSDIMQLNMYSSGRICEITLAPEQDTECSYSLDIVIADRKKLIKLVRDGISRSYTSIARDLYQREVHNLKMFGYPIEGYSSVIDGMQSYVATNMALLDREVRRQLFTPDRPVYTKVRDNMSAKYGLDSVVRNSLIADGCIIEGTVENSILFRGVHVGKGAVVRNCIIMQSGEIGAGAKLEYICTDKDVVIGDERELAGTDRYQVYVRKASVV
jgi:glucose-1-phosphate adenylyltransferase